MEEIWKQVPSYPDIYASSLGRIKLCDIHREMPNGGTRIYRGTPQYGYEDKTASGRDGVPKRRTIYIGRYKKTFKVHRLVCEAFHGAQPNKNSVVMHLNENPSDNRPENLFWGTQKQNLNMPQIKEYHRSVCVEKMKNVVIHDEQCI